MDSAKPRKQRKGRFNADTHMRQKLVHSHIAKELKAKLNIKKRSIAVRKGDTVKVMGGSNAGKTGKVNRVDLGRGFVYIEGIIRKNSKGKELMIPIRPSKVYITDLDMSDKLRKAKLGLS